MSFKKGDIVRLKGGVDLWEVTGRVGVNDHPQVRHKMTNSYNTFEAENLVLVSRPAAEKVTITKQQFYECFFECLIEKLSSAQAWERLCRASEEQC